MSIRFDPLIFDLNNDGKVEIQGAEAAGDNANFLPAGLWDITVLKAAEGDRFLISDSNIGNGEHNAIIGQQLSINSGGRWGLALTSQSQEKAKVTMTSEDRGTIQAGGLELRLVMTSDGGYARDGKGVVSSGGERVLFDLNPESSSWEFQSWTFRPGLNAPAAKGGQAIYDSGQTESIGSKWTEDSSKGNSAKIYSASKEWIGEWIGYGNRCHEQLWFHT